MAEARAEAPAGVYVEPKGLTVTLHWRRAPDRKDWVLAFAERQHARHGLAVHPGRAERELRPPIDVDKGTVVRALAAEHAGQLRAVAVFGDDMGDLPAFAAVGELTSPDGRPARRGAGRGGRRREPAPRWPPGRPDRAGRRGRGRAAARAGRRRHRRVRRRLSPERTAAAAASWSAHQSADVRARTAARSAPARRARSGGPMESAAWSASAVPDTSKGLTPSAPPPASASSSHAPASRESTSTPSAVLSSGPSLATRLSPSRTGLTSSTSERVSAASERARSSSTDSTMGVQPSAPWPRRRG